MRHACLNRGGRERERPSQRCGDDAALQTASGGEKGGAKSRSAPANAEGAPAFALLHHNGVCQVRCATCLALLYKEGAHATVGQGCPAGPHRQVAGEGRASVAPAGASARIAYDVHMRKVPISSSVRKPRSPKPFARAMAHSSCAGALHSTLQKQFKQKCKQLIHGPPPGQECSRTEDARAVHILSGERCNAAKV